MVVSLLLLLAGCQSPGNLQQIEAGYAALDRKQYDQAIAAADQYLAQSPQGPGAAAAAYLRGRAVYDRIKTNRQAAVADIQEARNRYVQALSLSPQPALEGLIRADMANLSYHQEQFASAEREWLAAHELVDSVEVKGLIAFQVARCRQRLGRWAEADRLLADIQRTYANTDLAKSAADKQGYTGFWVQIGAYARVADADKAVVAARAQAKAADLQVIRKPAANYHMVLVGPRDYAGAKLLKEQMSATYKDAFIRP